ncbi:tetratricopeptide repeat protein [Pedobacter fastidiosus]|uniref:Tetratricopeptide repeat protein n=1 Tax=Pedobacter fastidiosus TaxID=2765361 RepID=A0ABR7KLE9_9SPHI|nr:tetratricopeptide repeat protein [Pedobacter fastidiosus]MBC6108906.1 tetratricopeptide repeat protein [Pedobacter fastidiosus]
MEFLKRILLFSAIGFSVFEANAQANSALQKAFQNSYNDEGKKNYSQAISDVMPFYAENNYELNLRIGWLYYLAKNYTSSQTYYLRAVNIRPNAVEAKFGLVKPLSLMSSWDKVLDQYNDILRLDPQNTQANYWAGVIIYNRKQYASASKYFAKVVSLYPFDYDGNHMLGWSMLFSGRKAEAKASFERALLIKPGDTSSIDGINRAIK